MKELHSNDQIVQIISIQVSSTHLLAFDRQCIEKGAIVSLDHVPIENMDNVGGIVVFRFRPLDLVVKQRIETLDLICDLLRQTEVRLDDWVIYYGPLCN